MKVQGGSIVAAAIRGDGDALRTVWQTHRRWVAAILLAHKSRDADLDDLLQEVAMSVVKNIRTVREEGAFKPWLRMVAINAARAAGRKSHDASGAPRLSLVGQADPGSGLDDADAHLRQREEARRLMDLAMKLPEGYREPLLLRCVRGLSYARIAELMEIPETTVETRIARGRRMLREMAESEEHLDRMEGRGPGPIEPPARHEGQEHPERTEQ